MDTDVTGLCRDHSFETAEEVCRRCGLEYCALCLVYPFGARKPLCKECAMTQGGVRSHTQRAAMGRRDLRKKVKAFRDHHAARSATASGGSEDVPARQDPLEPLKPDFERTPVTVPATEDPAPLEQTAPGPAPLSDPIPAPEPARGPQGPAGGVAPPIDWNQPFG